MCPDTDKSCTCMYTLNLTHSLNNKSTPYSEFISRGHIFMDWTVKTFHGYILRIITK